MRVNRFLHRSSLVALLAFLATSAQLFGADHHTSKFSFNGKDVAVDTYDAQAASDDAQGKPGAIVLLHGASGPDLPTYREQADFFATRGFTVFVLHYFDATKSAQTSPQNYAVWANLVDAYVRQLIADPTTKTDNVFLLGYSLGASVALAAGSQGTPATAIAEWYGSLPDEFFYKFKTMPPLLILHGQRDNNIPVSNAQQLIQLCGMKQLTCESHIYEGEGHGFAGSALADANSRTLAFLAKHQPAK